MLRIEGRGSGSEWQNARASGASERERGNRSDLSFSTYYVVIPCDTISICASRQYVYK